MIVIFLEDKETRWSDESSVKDDQGKVGDICRFHIYHCQFILSLYHMDKDIEDKKTGGEIPRWDDDDDDMAQQTTFLLPFKL